MIAVVKVIKKDVKSELVGVFRSEKSAIERMFSYANEVYKDKEQNKGYCVQIRHSESNIVDFYETDKGVFIDSKRLLFSLQCHKITQNKSTNDESDYLDEYVEEINEEQNESESIPLP